MRLSAVVLISGRAFSHLVMKAGLKVKVPSRSAMYISMFSLPTRGRRSATFSER